MYIKYVYVRNRAVHKLSLDINDLIKNKDSEVIWSIDLMRSMLVISDWWIAKNELITNTIQNNQFQYKINTNHDIEINNNLTKNIL